MRAGRLRTGWQGHLLLAYGSEIERQQGLAAWVRDGLASGEKLVCSELPDGSGALVRMLKRNGVQASAAVSSGRIEVRAPAETVTELSSPAALRRRLVSALEAGFTGVRVALDPVARGGLPAARACAAVGRAVEDLGGGRLAGLCQRDRRATADDLVAAVAAHPRGFRTTMLTSRPTGGGLALAGEVDISNVGLFAAALDRVIRTAGRVVWLDLADLRFMDVAGCRALVLALLGVDQLRGVGIVGRRAGRQEPDPAGGSRPRR
jgi:hypothetical protein